MESLAPSSDVAVDPREVAICTIHGNTPDYFGEVATTYPWPRLQIEQLRRFTAEGYRVFAYGNRLMKEHEDYLRSCSEVQYFSSREILHGEYDHVWPLRNWLTRRAAKEHRWIIHLDSDAFPVRADWLPRCSAMVTAACPVVAVKRLENGDHHSDRCFLMFSSEGLHKHLFDFSKVGVIDAGAGISENLEADGFQWRALMRTNRLNYHELIAGIYDDCIYHHAAGTRKPVFRCNVEAMNKDNASRHREMAVHRILFQRLFEHTDTFLQELRGEVAPFDIERAVRDFKCTYET